MNTRQLLRRHMQWGGIQDWGQFDREEIHEIATTEFNSNADLYRNCADGPYEGPYNAAKKIFEELQEEEIYGRTIFDPEQFEEQQLRGNINV